MSYRFDVLRLISSRLSSVQRNLVERLLVTSNVQKWVFHDMQMNCSQLEATGSLLAFLISLAQNSSRRRSLISPPLLRCLCESDGEFLSCILLLRKSYLACLLLLSESTSSQVPFVYGRFGSSRRSHSYKYVQIRSTLFFRWLPEGNVSIQQRARG